MKLGMAAAAALLSLTACGKPKPAAAPPVATPQALAEHSQEFRRSVIEAAPGVWVAVGFGISGPEQARQVRDWGADGAIVGSALVKAMAEAHGGGADVAAAAASFCSDLRRALDV